ncbi:nitroreductase [Candidatus Bathyarchaeota archaeon]|nr:nitroreductase [Candidatus Bathyarchaeota archaeon]
MDVFEAIQKRKSVRSYEPTTVQVEKLRKVLEAARLAPSAGNIQPWRFIVVLDSDKRRKIASGCRFGRFLAESPVVIVGCGDQRASPRWYAIDTCIAMENLVLAATGEGLGTCWIGFFNEKEIREMLKIPSRLKVVALLALGYPRKKLDILAKLAHLIRPRKKLEKIAYLEEYGKEFPFSS